jgi:fructuronate reductase
VAAEPAQLNLARLSAATAGQLAPEVAQPTYDRYATGTSMAHIGVGAFMRAHLAVYNDDVLASGSVDWGISGFSLRSSNVFEQLQPQDCLYTLGVFSAEQSQYRLVASIKSIEVAPHNPQSLIDRIAAPETHIVSITVTEKGYCIDAERGCLNREHPDIQHDLEYPATPRSLVGFLAAGLATRRDKSGTKLAIMSCDNLPANGSLLRTAVMEFAQLADDHLATWIENNVSFPSTMVDRIVPATTEEDLERTAKRIGLRDDAYVGTEAFTQWVIEDNFAAGRPRWDEVGALLVDDVAPFEAAKLRLLNGAHSTIAYAGFLAGYRYVHEVMRDADIARFVRALMIREISPVTPEPRGMEHTAYIDDLLQRFRNPSLQHRTSQIAMDGSQKLPQRLLGTIRDRIKIGAASPGLALAVAAWVRYCLGRDDSGKPIEVNDPMAERFAIIAADSGNDARRIVGQFLAIREIFGTDLPGEADFRTALESSLQNLLADGVVTSIRTHNQEFASDGQ